MIKKIGKAVIKTDPLLALSLMARNFGLDPARLLHINDEACALDLRLCAAARLMAYDTERENLA